MPKKYHIHVHATPNRFPVIGRSGIVDWGEGCLKCAKCVKTECVYGVYKARRFSTDIFGDTIDQLCKSCFRCVQGCPKRLIHKTINPEWESLGDDLYTPETISITWTQAETGAIPVSGAGYGGKFSGPGFDSMWTDMSEIVRPTRDGIHGREYISTIVEIGRKPFRLQFSQDGKLLTKLQASVRLPIPVIFDMFPFGDLSDNVWRASAIAASRLQTLLFLPFSESKKLEDLKDSLVPIFTSLETESLPDLDQYKMVEFFDEPSTLTLVRKIKSDNPDQVVSVRMAALSDKAHIKKVIDYCEAGIDSIHYVADERGYEPSVENGLHIKDIIKEVHSALVRSTFRDEVSFLISGGVAMAEHVIKSILCGANMVGIDIPLLVALECRVCRNCREGGDCPVSIAQIDPTYGADRMVNLMGAWHNQLLEMMGAMGIREARRLRGEQGRVMFRENLESDTFAQLFMDSSS